MVIEFKRQGEDYTKPQGIKFSRTDEDGNTVDLLVAVTDKFPQMGDVHIEGRRIVEVSVEMFIPLMAAMGFEVVPPTTEQEPDLSSRATGLWPSESDDPDYDQIERDEYYDGLDAEREDG